MGARVARRGNVFLIKWESDGVQIGVRSIREHGDRVSAQVTVHTTLPPYGSPEEPAFLSKSVVNLATEGGSRKSLRDKLALRCPGPEWDAIVEELCNIVLTSLEEPEPVIDLWGSDEYVAPEFVIDPILPEGLPTAIFGLPQSGKSEFGLYLAMLAQWPEYSNPFGWGTKSDALRVAYVDWETSEAEIGWRWKCLLRGAGCPDMPLLYIPSVRPLSDMEDRLQEVILQNDVKLLIVDSLGLACGNDSLIEDTTARRFYRTVRQLRVTTLILAHKAKGDGDTGIFGSQFFKAGARYAWELKRSQRKNDSSVNLALVHHKTNIGPMHETMGLRISFSNTEGTKVTPTDYREVAEFKQLAGPVDRIKDYLATEGWSEVKDIAVGIGDSADRVRANLNNYRDKLFTKEGHKWSVMGNE